MVQAQKIFHEMYHLRKYAYVPVLSRYYSKIYGYDSYKLDYFQYRAELTAENISCFMRRFTVRNHQTYCQYKRSMFSHDLAGISKPNCFKGQVCCIVFSNLSIHIQHVTAQVL
jgi:hypothetical protein